MTDVAQLSSDQLTGQNDSHIKWIADNTGIHHEMVSAFNRMQSAAKDHNIELTIASGFRSFERQNLLWNNKFCGKTLVKDIDNQPVDIQTLSENDKIKAILLYSAIPGTSRHHWGSDIDIYALNLLPEETKLQLEPWEYSTSGPFGKLSQWLDQNAADFGFYFPYDRYRNGVAAEPWHLSYGPLAREFQQALTIDKIVEVIDKSDVAGKLTIIKNIDDIYRDFVININPIQDSNS